MEIPSKVEGILFFCCPFDVIEANGTFSKTIYIRERLGIISVSINLGHILHAVTKSEISLWSLLCQKVSKILYGIGGENSESSLSQFFFSVRVEGRRPCLR